MLSGTPLIFSLFNNLALFVSLVAAYAGLATALRRVDLGTRFGWLQRQLALGLLFGLFALGCMNATIPVAPGVRVDQRNAIVALSGAFGGPLSALVTGAVAAAYRWYLSGSGVLSGVTGVGLAALAGIGLHRLPAPFRHPLPAFGAALGATLLILPGFLLAGAWPHGLHLMLAMALPYGTAILLAIALGGLLLDGVERYREAEQRFRRMVAEAPEALVVVDPGGRVRLFNAKAEAFSGLRGAEVLGCPLAALRWLGGALATHLARAQAAPARLPPFEIEDAAAGRVFEALAAPVLARMGGTEWMLTLRDVTERKHAEAARADYEARILESKSLEALGRLAGGVAHDFNNMLSVILGTTEVLSAEAGLPPAVREDLAQLATAAQRAADLTAQLLAFARRQVLEPQPLDPNAAVTGLVPLLRRSLPESIELVVRLEPKLPRVLVDATQLDQVLVNLAVNARDAMPGGGVITLETRAHAQPPEQSTSHPELAPGSYVVFSVSDSGAGMTTRCAPASSSPSSRPRSAARGPAWAWPRSTASSGRAGARSASTASRARAPASGSSCPPPTGRPPPPRWPSSSIRGGAAATCSWSRTATWSARPSAGCWWPWATRSPRPAAAGRPSRPSGRAPSPSICSSPTWSCATCPAPTSPRSSPGNGPGSPSCSCPDTRRTPSSTRGSSIPR
jgi:PAS domain S-box-containing protein